MPTMSERQFRSDAWADEPDADAAPAVRALTRQEAQALRERHPPLSLWRVVAVQALVGGVVALLAGLLFGSQAVAWSALYGAAAVVLPAALMARGMTSRLSSVTLGAGAVSFMTWEAVKIVVSVAMLVLAPKLVQDLNWPALLVGMVVCMKVNWLALLRWSRTPKSTEGI